jgi:hypothetical protein
MSTDYTDFEKWKTDGLALGLKGPRQIQGKNHWTFGEHNTWSGTKGSLARTVPMAQAESTAKPRTASELPDLTPRDPNAPVPHAALQPAKVNA